MRGVGSGITIIMSSGENLLFTRRIIGGKHKRDQKRGRHANSPRASLRCLSLADTKACDAQSWVTAAAGHGVDLLQF